MLRIYVRVNISDDGTTCDWGSHSVIKGHWVVGATFLSVKSIHPVPPAGLKQHRQQHVIHKPLFLEWGLSVCLISVVAWWNDDLRNCSFITCKQRFTINSRVKGIIEVMLWWCMSYPRTPSLLKVKKEENISLSANLIHKMSPNKPLTDY